MTKKLYGVADAAKELGIAPSDVRACIDDGTIVPESVSGRYVLDADDLAVLADEFDATDTVEDDGEDEDVEDDTDDDSDEDD